MKLKDLARIILAGVVIYYVSQFFPQSQWLFIVWGGILFIIYLTVLFLFGEIKKEDGDFLKRMLFKKKTNKS